MSPWEVALIGKEIIRNPTPGAVVECGCFKGGSTATLSVACRKANRILHVFDSFCGLPPTTNGDASHTVLSENTIHHCEQGVFAGSLETVKANVSKAGSLESCRFYSGFFEETLPRFKERLAVVFCDVDLVESLKTCLRYLWPLLGDGGALFTHEAHHLEVAKLFYNDVWWRQNLSQNAPGLIGAGSGLGLSLRRHDGYHKSCLGMIRKNPAAKPIIESSSLAG